MFRHKLFDWPQCKIIVDVALGNIETARTICKEKKKISNAGLSACPGSRVVPTSTVGSYRSGW
jgi:hypothetical protein